MTRLRARAADLSERYDQVATKRYGTAEAYFLREAASLHAEMRAYVDYYRNFGWQDEKIDPFSNTTPKVVEEIQDAVSARAVISRDQAGIPTLNASVDINLALPPDQVYGEFDRMDAEILRFQVAPNGKIRRLMIDEFFQGYDDTFCLTLGDLKKAHAAGAKLSEQQQALLAKYETDESLDLVAPRRAQVNPLELLYIIVPPELGEKMKGQFRVGSDYPRIRTTKTGNLLIIGTHHPSIYQSTLDLDTTNLTNEEVYQLVGYYIDTLRGYPRVSKKVENQT